MALEKKVVKSLFVEFKNKGDSFQGVYRGFSERPNKKGGFQKVWDVAATESIGKASLSKKDGGGTEKIVKGENYHIGETTVMSSIRLDLDEGQEFKLVSKGKVANESGGAPYYDFDYFTEGGQ